MAYQQYNQWVPMQTYSHNAGWQQNTQQFEYKPTASAQELPVDSPEIETEAPKKSKRESWFTGLKNSLRLWLIGAVTVLLVNLIWLIVARAKYPFKNGSGIIQEGPCGSIKQTNIWLHLLINILSTLLLTGSNAFMAAYSSPTRKEVDKCHARKRWLHIGFTSWRNLRGIAFRKSLVVMILGISSIPFHLLYNSLIYGSLASNAYNWVIVTEDYAGGAPYDLGDSTDSMLSYFADMQKNVSHWSRLENKDCIRAYSSAFVSDRRNVVLVSSTKNDATSILRYGSADFDKLSLTNNWWICSLDGNDGGNQFCNPEDYISKAASWEVNGYPIEYCYSEKVDGLCSIRFSQDIMIIVLSFNALKLIVMAWVFFRFDAEKILAAVGDAAASFLSSPDVHTTAMCLASRRNIDRSWQSPGVGILYSPRRQHWGQAIAKKRWILFLILFAFSIFIIFVFGGILGFQNTKAKGIPLTPSSLWKLGFGTVSATSMVFYGSLGNALTMSLLANSPQVFLAAIYMMYMGITTSMFVAADWARFGTNPQTLMVSEPKGKQRGTWLLGAPLKYGTPILILQTLLHWFVSQGLFLVQIQPYNIDGTIDDTIGMYSNCGYSPIAITATVVVSCILILTSIIFMFFRFETGSPPVVSTCSAAISASCHVPPMPGDENMVLGELRWGVTAQMPNAIGHCSLGPANRWEKNQAGAPRPDFAYAGLQFRSKHINY